MRGVWTPIVSSRPCSSPTCDRAGTPAGPIRTDKIFSGSHVWKKEFAILKVNILSPEKVKVFLRVIDSPSSLGVYCPIQVRGLIFSQPTFNKQRTTYFVLFSLHFILHLDNNVRTCLHPRIIRIRKIFLAFICHIPTNVLGFPGENDF